MTVQMLLNPQVHALRARIRELEALRRRVGAELASCEARLLDLEPQPRRRRSRHVRPECGTEAGYQWHRYHEPDRWPLPPEDPCGCRAAHARRGRGAHDREQVRSA